MANLKRIKSIDELRELSMDKQLDCCISNGVWKSSKSIWYFSDEKKFEIHHEIDDTFEKLDNTEIIDSNVGQSIKEGTFYRYIYN